MDSNYHVITPFSKYSYFKGACSSQFCWYHQNWNQPVKTENSMEVIKEFQIMYKIQFVSLFPNITKVANFWWKMLMSAYLKKWFVCFLNVLYLRCNYAKFHHCGICITDMKILGFLLFGSSLKSHILNGVKHWNKMLGRNINRLTCI